ncbi:unnamed protein product, partial [Medioppia subpectinata]
MLNLNKSLKWKSIAIESNDGFTDKDFEGLVEIEELDDYDIQSHDHNNSRTTDPKLKTKSKKAKKCKVNKKEKQTNELTDDLEEETPERCESMDLWQNMCIPEPILRSLSDLRFSSPLKWKSIAIESNDGFTDKDFEGLVEIEELDDYDIQSHDHNNSQTTDPKLKTKSKKTKKRLGYNSSNSLNAKSSGTPIQSKAIKVAIEDRVDILGAAQTGSGKTLAFGIPLVTHIMNDKLDNDVSQLRALVLTPTRELAIQVKKHLEAITKYSGVSLGVLVGGMSVQKQERILKKVKPDILVATPGRLWELMGDQSNEHLTADTVSRMKYLVIDEADRMAEKGHFKDLVQLMDLLRAKRTQRQTKDCLRRVVNVLKLLEVKPLPLHSSMPQKRRLANLEKFEANSESVLIASDVAARGLDIPCVDHVVHYQIPRTAEIYVHRSGRTARAFNTGLSLMLCEPKEETNYYKEFAKTLHKGNRLQEFPIDKSLMKTLKQRIDLAQKCDQLDHKIRKERSRDDWFRVNAEKCEILSDNLAQKCDQLDHKIRKERSRDDWFRVNAEKCEILSDSESNDSDDGMDTNSKDIRPKRAIDLVGDKKQKSNKKLKTDK